MFDPGAASNAIFEVATTLLFIAAVVAVLEGVLYLILVRWLKARLAVPIMLLAPAVLGLLALNLYPLVWEFNVSFTKMGLRNFFDPGILGLTAKRNIFVGIENYVNVFTQPILQQAGFLQLLVQTVIWTVVNVVLHVVARHGPRAVPQPATARQGPVSGPDHPAVGDPGLHLAPDLANRVQPAVRGGQPAARDDRHRSDPVAVRRRSGTSWR